MEYDINVIKEISPSDNMFQGNEEHYFNVGQSALNAILIGMQISNKDKSTIKRILDLPSGHGRVLRYLRSFFPTCEIMACDIDKDGVDFCSKTFGATSLYSSKNVDEISFMESFDLIWCGSLFTHLDKNNWISFLNLFTTNLEDNGLLIFTVHGRQTQNFMELKKVDYGLEKSSVKKLLQNYKKNGFGYEDYPGQRNYGISISTPSFVLSLLEKRTDLKILVYNEKGWDNHQDVIVCQKENCYNNQIEQVDTFTKLKSKFLNILT